MEGRLDPLLKWPGGKRALLARLLAHVPLEFGRYYEPFFGGGALFFALRPRRALLSDLNEDLIHCYATVRDNPEAVIRQLRLWSNSSAAYYSIRASQPRANAHRAAKLIYLSTLAFNGIYRVNRRGEFNVPYGHKTHLDVAQAGRIRAISRALTGAQLRHSDFEQVVKGARAGDFVYLDPPYTVAHGTNGFRKYNAQIFSWADQTRLATVAHDLARRGCHVIISNANHPSVRKLYTGFDRLTVPRVSRVAASSDARRLVQELVITNITRRVSERPASQ